MKDCVRRVSKGQLVRQTNKSVGMDVKNQNMLLLTWQLASGQAVISKLGGGNLFLETWE